MGKRSRLFASAAFPLLSLSLAFEPAAAAALREQPIVPLNNGIAGAAATAADTSFEVAQQEAPAAQPDEEQLKHKKPAEGGEGQKHQGGGEQQHQMKQAEPEGEPQQKAPKQQQPEAQPPKAEHQQPAEQEQPKPQKQQPAAEAPPEPKKQRQQPAEEPQAQPEAKPQPKSVAPQAEPEAPQPKPKVKQPEAKQPVEQEQPKPQKQQPAEAPQPKVEQQPATEAQPEAKPEPKVKPGSKAQQPAPAEKQAPAAGEQPNQGAQPGKQAQPEQNAQPKPQGQTEAPAKQPTEPQPAPAGEPAQGHKVQPGTQPQTQAQPGTPATPGAEQGQKQGGDKTHGKQPQNQQQGEQPAANPQQPAQQSSPQGQPAQAGNPATPQPGKQQPANGAATPAQAGAAAPATNGNGQQAGEIQLPPAEQVSPQELERRKKIAENPASANGPVILPVENGSAVLDSQKDAVRRGEHLNNGQNPAAPGAQGGRGQAGQASPSGQAQTAPAQQPPPAYTKPPTSDAEAQRAAAGGQPQPPVKMEAVTSEQGRRIDRRPDFAPPQGTTVQTIINQDNRTIVNVDNTYVVRHDDSERFIRGGERPVYEQLPRDRYRETIDQPDGDRVVTIRNRYGDIIQRSRIDASGREYVLFYSPELENRPDNDDYYRDPGEDLPPMRLLIPLSQYIIDTASNRNADYYDFLREPPVEPVERIYSVNEVRYSARIRDKIRRIDLDTITFAMGSAEIPMSQASTLRGVADGMLKIIKRDPTETFLIEGHTDAVGSAQSNLILSDQRAESVANVLTDVYGIPAENLVTQGYGEQYLKVNTLGPSQENRRVTIRRITPLVRPVASNR
ncbi:OmpA family protein [Rhizobium miluonense]|jgi:outer membrane protein OmpA-like peptidoglycan-associated protein|uniref:Outer membrane protein OmpA-like peptidoglycan-associated protein n=1 Tax=Rhizobium miluonense TaxID=411945 RepID=A0ABU1SRY8_9HYPH|nr:OmpA family protein [Rhizobium miluonense]MDR6901736.1 outer membrane protein OmpA-like peptidoglycan-associated protein [Rhizobium miluonense]